MNPEFYDEQFETRALTPATWALTGQRLRRSADIVMAGYNSDLKTMESGASPLELRNLELSGCATLLYGLALENLLKAIIIKTDPAVIIDGELRRWPAGGHDLLILCNVAKIKTTKVEKDLLARLTSFVRWAGRYPIPNAASNMRLAQSSVDPDFIPLPFNPHELPASDALYARLESQVTQT